MSKTDDYIKELQDTASKHAKYLKLAFLAVIVELRNKLKNNPDLVTAFKNRNVEEIIRIANINELDNLLHGIGMDKSNFIFSDEVRSIFNAGAMAAFWNLTVDSQKQLNFNPLNERASAFVLQDGANLARELVLNTEAGLRQAVTRLVDENAITEARIKELIQTIGLTNDQTTALLNFRSQLEARQVLGFTSPTDRRISETDRILINQHMKGNGLSKDQVDGLVNRYYESLLNKRAIDIATTESMRAIHNGQQELWQQGLDSGVLNDAYRKFWITVGDNKVRITHAVIPGMNPGGVKIDGYFATPHGPVLSPGDRSSSGFVNCRCNIIILLKV